MQIFVQCFVARICRMQIAHREWPSGNKSIQTTEKAQNVINLVLNSFFFLRFWNSRQLITAIFGCECSDKAKVKPIFFLLLLLLNRAFINNRGNIIFFFLLHPFVWTTTVQGSLILHLPKRKEERTSHWRKRNEVGPEQSGMWLAS